MQAKLIIQKLHLDVGCSALEVTGLTAVHEIQGSNPIHGSSVFIAKNTAVYNFGDGLHTVTAVPGQISFLG